MTSTGPPAGFATMIFTGSSGNFAVATADMSIKDAAMIFLIKMFPFGAELQDASSV
jgi:hypothetical protein